MCKIYPVYTTVTNKPTTICYELEEKVFDFPFFNDGINETRVNSKPYNLQSVRLPDETDRLELKGLIFNVSHCGSTLLSKMLGQLKKVKVISESEAINGLLLSKILHNLKDEYVITQLRTIINIYQQKTNSKEHLILKLTSWNVYLIKLFQQAFPNVKWIFLDRSTEHLVKSLLKADGGFIDWWNHPVDIIRKYFINNTVLDSKEIYLREMIKGHRNHATNNKNANSLFVSYPNFLEDYEKILAHFQLNATIDEIKISKDTAKFDSKSVQKKFWKKD